MSQSSLLIDQIGFGLIALVRDKFGGNGLKRVGLLVGLGKLGEALLLAWIEAENQLALRFIAPSPRAVLEANCRIRADCELALLSAKSVGEIPRVYRPWASPIAEGRHRLRAFGSDPERRAHSGPVCR